MSLKESIAAGYKIVHDANLQGLPVVLGCRLSQTSSVLQKNLAAATLTKPGILVSRQRAIMNIRNNSELNWDPKFARAAEIETELIPFFQDSGDDKNSLENDAIAQLSFEGDIFKPLNNIPWMICVIAMFKVWFVPAMTLITPILAWILPYILLRFVYALPINQQEYVNILQGMWAGNMIPGAIDAPAPDLLSPRSIFQFILFAFSFTQSMIQPIQTAMHLHKTDGVIVGIGKKLVELRDIVRTFRAESHSLDVKLTDTLEEIADSDYRRAFFLIKEQPERIRMAFRDLAGLEVLWRISKNPIMQPVAFKRDVLVINDMVDISLEDAVASSIELTTTRQRHAIITGPNGGGKSSFLRAVLQSVVLGHSYGVAPAKMAHMPRFLWIASGLQLRDTPGLYSLFETEVKFAADSIRSARQAGPGLVLFDELFHSTNPPDGVRSAELFLKKLWAPECNAFSIVSTHVFPLVEAAPANVQAICCPASESFDGTIRFSYEVRPGICSVSSVRTVWDKYGLRVL
jgi:MutS domain V